MPKVCGYFAKYALPLHQSLQQFAKCCGAPRVFEWQHRLAVWCANTHYILCISARACTRILYFVKLSALCTLGYNYIDNQLNTQCRQLPKQPTLPSALPARMRPPVLLRQTVKSVTADRKTCRINSKIAPPVPKNAIGTYRQAMSADKVLHPCRQGVAPVQRKNKYCCLVKRIRTNGIKHQTLSLMGARVPRRDQSKGLQTGVI